MVRDAFDALMKVKYSLGADYSQFELRFGGHIG